MAHLSIKSLRLFMAPNSGCSSRVRITANLKEIPLSCHKISISELQQTSYKASNPNSSLPWLVVETAQKNPSATSEIIITQSPAIIDFLESHYPTPPLLPSTDKVKDRARALELASLVACDIQPPQNTRIRKKIAAEFGGDGEA